jgi:PAS domain S-box-containing protein
MSSDGGAAAGGRDAFLRAVLERSPALSGVVGADGRFTFLSGSAGAILGRSPEEVTALEKPLALVHPDDRGRVAETLRAVLARPGALERIACRISHRDGSYRELDVAAVNLLHDPDIQGVLLNARDMTDAFRAEQQLRKAQKLESVGRLAVGVAHDFNNVLTVILSCAESLRRQLDGGQPVAREDVDQVYSAAERARNITFQLLGVARRQVISPEALDLNRAVETARKMLARLASENVDVVLDLEQGLWPVRLDPSQVDQLLINLVANARDALPRGGRIEIATRNLEIREAPPAWPDAGPGAYVTLRVTDDGVGMSPRVRNRIFDPFFTTKEIGLGTGLGLATVHGIVAQNQGRIRVESERGRGSRFEILFPRTAEAVVQASTPAPDEVKGGNETVLLVEDDPGVRRQALRVLAEAGYQVHVAADGLEALEFLGLNHLAPDLLLTDVVMPRLDGPNLAGLVRERWPGIRILFMSGYADDRLTATGILRPRVDLVHKPFTGTSLLQRVRAVLDRPA